MDEETEVAEIPSVGERLAQAREEQGFSLDDIAAETRIPLRHLQNLEAGEWDKLPAPTYTIGFAKSYASAVGLDRGEIGDQLRGEMGTFRPDTSTVEHFEPADPAQSMPKWIVISAIVAIVVAVLLFTWIRNRSLTEEPQADIPVATQSQPVQQAQPVPGSPAAQGQQAAAQGPVVITATAPAWISSHRPGQDPVRRHDAAGASLYGALVRHRSDPSRRRAGSASHNGGPLGCSACRSVRPRRRQRQPAPVGPSRQRPVWRSAAAAAAAGRNRRRCG